MSLRSPLWMKVQVARVASLVALGCAGCNGSALGAGADASTSQAGADAEPNILVQPDDGSTCDGTKPPSADPCVVDDAFGVFVSPHGQSGAAGTKADPFAKIADAVRAAVSANKRVYACAGTYDERLTLDATSDGVALYGGLDCTSWAYTGGGQAEGGTDAGASALTVLGPTLAGVVLAISQITKGVTFEDFGFQAAAGGNAGDSSIAVVVEGSSHVVLRRCSIAAGAASDGMDGRLTDNAGEMDAGGTDAGSVIAAAPWQGGVPSGGNATGTSAGAGTVNTCGSSVSIGGAGGSPAPDGGADGTPSSPNYGRAYKQLCGGFGNGMVGADGDAGGPGAGATTWASVEPTGWSPTPGQPGGPGQIGQAGGGGASVDTSGGGGGGGPAGCGGAGGPGGQGGGSSIAVLVVAGSTSLVLEQCTLNASNAGRGGNGAAGQSGQPGGMGGLGAGRGCAGGNGGTGGGGGGGGGGAGGLSAGVAWTASPGLTINGQGAVPMGSLPNTNTTLGASGAGGLHGSGGPSEGGGAGAGPDGTDGKSGTAQGIVELP